MSLPGTKAMKNQHPGEDVIRVLPRSATRHSSPPLSNTAYVVVREGSHVSCTKVTHITPRTSPEFPVHSWRGSNRSPHPRITSPPRGQDIQESAGKRRVRCGARRQGGLVICCASVDLTRSAQRSRVLGVTARRHSAGRQTKQRAGLCGRWRSRRPAPTMRGFRS